MNAPVSLLLDPSSPAPNPNTTPKSKVQQAWRRLKAQGLRTRDAAAELALSEAELVQAHRQASWDGRGEPSSASDKPVLMRSQRLRGPWLALLQALQRCGPLMALTRNAHVVHEKTGIYEQLSGNERMALALGPDIDLRLFLSRWTLGFLVQEPVASGSATSSRPAWRSSLQFFDAQGQAVHKIFPVADTDLEAWQQQAAQWVDPHAEDVDLRLGQPALHAGEDPSASVPETVPVSAQAALLQDWAAMQDPHEFFEMLRRHGLSRRQALHAAAGPYTRALAPQSVEQLLTQAARQKLPLMIFVGNPGCIQIHTGPVQHVVQRGPWLNVLDAGFNLHVRSDRIHEVWRVDKPTRDGMVTSVEVLDACGELMLMAFGQRKPGQAQHAAWHQLALRLPTAVDGVAS